ncbi:MAG: DUF447 family protein [Planctomycetales bacterium]
MTTLSGTGELNIAPMGPVVDPAQTEFLLRPFHTSQTYRNLKENPCGVLHVTDDVLLLARAALGMPLGEIPTRDARTVRGKILTDSCRWWEFEVAECDDSRPRTEIRLRIVDSGSGREFWGFNRAKHAVLEATILATRLHLLPGEFIQEELNRLRIPVEKTAGPDEATAFQLVEEYIRQHGNQVTQSP